MLNHFFQDVKDVVDFQDRMRILYEEASKPDADITCMKKLKEMIAEADNLNISLEEVEIPQETLKKMEDRISKVCTRI